MGLFHRHHWSEVSRHYIEPNPSGITKLARFGGSEEQWRSMIFGNYTVIELRCDECGDIRQRTLDGDATHKPLRTRGWSTEKID